MIQALMGGFYIEGCSEAWSEELVDGGQEWGNMVKDLERSRGSTQAVALQFTMIYLLNLNPISTTVFTFVINRKMRVRTPYK